jgi:transcriptional/translational regulatory protein YebC/TACO1
VAGHSKWANIQHRKGGRTKSGARSGPVSSAKSWWLPAPVAAIWANPRCAWRSRRPRRPTCRPTRIKRNIDKATGNLEGVSYEEIRYEGYGIGGAAIIVDTMTDNRVRTVAEVRHAFSKYGGNMGTEGSVAFQFKHCGQLVFAPGTDEDKVMEVALEAGADDVIVDDDGAIEVLSRGDFETVPGASKPPASRPRWPR